ncbi:MAG: hypothetical protein IPM38_10785 [Ignavibacteria bacterium]|nr:hypothetical protein [Ignavibacteria bacterium]
MLKRIFFIAAFLIISAVSGSYNSASSQTLYFCEDVDSEGYAISESSVFNISSKGGFLKFLTRLPYSIGTTSVSYEIFLVDTEGNEKYESTIYQDVEKSWTWFWKEVTFYNAGRYNIYVYDGDKNFLTSSQIRIQYY